MIAVLAELMTDDGVEGRSLGYVCGLAAAASIVRMVAGAFS